jgi:hypothetical protein
MRAAPAGGESVEANEDNEETEQLVAVLCERFGVSQEEATKAAEWVMSQGEEPTLQGFAEALGNAGGTTPAPSGVEVTDDGATCACCRTYTIRWNGRTGYV